MYGGQRYQHSLVMASVIGSGWGELGGTQTSPFIPLTRSWCVHRWLARTVSTHLPLDTGRQRGGQDVLVRGAPGPSKISVPSYMGPNPCLVVSEKLPSAVKGQNHPVACLTRSHENRFPSIGKALVLLGKKRFPWTGLWPFHHLPGAPNYSDYPCVTDEAYTSEGIIMRSQCQASAFPDPL